MSFREATSQRTSRPFGLPRLGWLQDSAVLRVLRCCLCSAASFPTRHSTVFLLYGFCCVAQKERCTPSSDANRGFPGVTPTNCQNRRHDWNLHGGTTGSITIVIIIIKMIIINQPLKCLPKTTGWESSSRPWKTSFDNRTAKGGDTW